LFFNLCFKSPIWKKYFTCIWKRSLKCNKQIKNYSSKSFIDAVTSSKSSFLRVPTKSSRSHLNAYKMAIVMSMDTMLVSKALYGVIKKNCLNMSNILWDIGILVGYQTYGTPGRYHFLGTIQLDQSLEQNLWKTLSLHCCICCNPANGRVDFEERLAHEIQLHGTEWIVRLLADWDQSQKKKKLKHVWNWH
jgi:hypothetical protein